MSDPLPPLHALAAFEAAARQGGFQQAAEILHLTPSAVSHRIKRLEAFLGKPLFERRHWGVVLTPEGQRYYTAVHNAFQNIAAATDALRDNPHKCIRLSVAPALGGKWLVGRLTHYQEAHPEIDFELSTATGLAPLQAGDADLGLRYGHEEWPGFDAWKLFDEEIVVICSPDYAARLPGLPDPIVLDGARLLRHPLLSWRQWFAAVGLERPEPSGPRYEDALLMLEAAASGQGVALMTATLAAPYLASGALTQPLPMACPGLGFYAVAPHSTQAKPWVKDFIRWLIRNARTQDFA